MKNKLGITILLAVVIIVSAIFVTYTMIESAEPFPPSPPKEVGGVLDANAWQPATVMTNMGFMKHFPMDGVPIYYLPEGTKVYVQHGMEERYFVQYYADCLDSPISGWMWTDDVVLDIYLVPAK